MSFFIFYFFSTLDAENESSYPSVNCFALSPSMVVVGDK